jgi:hypothetical protein
MNGNTRANVALAGMTAAVLTPYAERFFKVNVTADEVMAIGAVAFSVWHGLMAALGPYAQRVFDHYFPVTSVNPTQPPVPPAQTESKS